MLYCTCTVLAIEKKITKIKTLMKLLKKKQKYFPTVNKTIKTK